MENKYLAHLYDEQYQNNKYPYASDFKLNSKQYVEYLKGEIGIIDPIEEYEKALDNWKEEDGRISKNFFDCMRENYNASIPTVNFAIDIVEGSDNGFSYDDVEYWVVALINHYEELKDEQSTTI